MNLIELAHQSGLTDRHLGDWMTDYGNSETSIREFAALVAEECAKECEQLNFEHHDGEFDERDWADLCAAAIRAKFKGR